MKFQARALLVASTLLGTMTSLAPAFADGMVSFPYDWVLELKTKPLTRQFEYQGSTLKKIEKVLVEYHPAKDADTKTAYEYLWYNGGKALGMEKQRKFDLPQGEGVAIRVSHMNGSSTEGENKAAANAILRLALDTYLNKNPIVQVRLPAETFNDIANHLVSLGMQVAPEGVEDGAYSSNLTLFLYSEPDGNKKVLYI